MGDGRSIEWSERSPDAEHAIGEDEPRSRIVVAALADALDCEGSEIAPLHATVDPEALDALFGRQHDGTPRTDGRVTFVHGECTVVVESDRARVYRD